MGNRDNLAGGFLLLETWLSMPVQGYENFYSISSFGQVRRELPGGRTHPGHILTPSVHPDGYLRVALFNGVSRKMLRIHRAVALAFIGIAPDDKPQVNHKDGNKKNNCVDNLEWASPYENTQHAIQVLGRRNSARMRAKLTDNDVRLIRHLAASTDLTHVQIATYFPVGRTQVQRICAGDHWRDI